jgi:membrane protein YdbS with pleckstrin-like domain
MRPLGGQEFVMSLVNIILVILILIFLGVLPTWSHSSAWGYYPSGGLGLVILILLVLIITGRI